MEPQGEESLEKGKEKEKQEEQLETSEDETLKYHLLGPSLTKAGQDAVDQRKVSEIIYNASKGSKFFNHEQNRDHILTAKIERILKEKARLEKMDLSWDFRKADEFFAELELTRDLSQYVVHVDCDAFFAAVEELDRPELKTVPMAVGKGVLTTCNYEARRYGCRSGMASFVAKKLCPQLVCLPQNYEKYTAKAKEIRAIMAQYDPLFESASIDEAYLNITSYCVENQLDPEETVQRMREEILEKTLVSVSAGIGPNAKIAKIASNRNKPNGQFRISNDRDAVMDFMKDLPVRKVNGVGRVFERELDSIGVKLCGDIYQQRGFLTKLFGEKAFQFLAQCYLGLGRTKIQPVENYERKSVGTETTFQEIGDKQELRGKLWWAAQELEKDLVRTEFKGRTLVLKVKLHSFEVLTRQTVPPRAVSVAKDLYAFALPMLSKLEKDIPNIKLRLLGLRCTNLVSTKKVGIEFFGVTSRSKPAAESTANANAEQEPGTEEAFEQAARKELQDEMDHLTNRLHLRSFTGTALSAVDHNRLKIESSMIMLTSVSQRTLSRKLFRASLRRLCQCLLKAERGKRRPLMIRSKSGFFLRDCSVDNISTPARPHVSSWKPGPCERPLSRASFRNNTSHAHLTNARYRKTLGTQATIQASKRQFCREFCGITKLSRIIARIPLS